MIGANEVILCEGKGERQGRPSVLRATPTKGAPGDSD